MEKEKPKSKPRRIIKKSIILLILILTAWAVVIRMIPSPKPNIAIDYAAKINKITKPENYDPNQNAALLRQQAIEAYIGEPEDMPFYLSPHVGTKEIQSLDESQFQIVKDWLNENEETLHYATLAVQQPYFWDEIEHSQDESIANILWNKVWIPRDIADAFISRAWLNELNGDIDQAFNDLTSAYSLSSLTGNRQFSELSYACRLRERIGWNIIDIIERRNPNHASLENLQINLDQYKLPEISRFFEIERLIYMDLVQRFFSDDGNGDGHLIAEIYVGETLNNMSGDINIIDKIRYFFEYRRVIGELYDRASKFDTRKLTVQKLEQIHAQADLISKKTPWQLQRETGETHWDNLRNFLSGHPLFEDFEREIRVCAYSIEKYHQGICSHQALITILAIKQYEAKEGNLPDSLQTLQKAGYIKTIPMDPYSPNPLAYKLTDEGFTL
ncbi:MAG: hypothetical protein FVQ79_09170, partial [Planctomycetes bacterium]|nr:hypothetical protein [Planctomycetota bacterium]